ncbi:MAG TPA: MgtC/SapB family protein [Bacteroidota bacterium]|nr:MgtC/SapB family protein [Bacteroidota bacterium]
MNGIEWTFEMRLGVALALGFLVGLERESTKIESQKLVFGGVRTHPIISLYGFGCAWLHKFGATFVLPVGLLSMTILTAIAYYAKIKNERYGSTSEISALLTFIVGALALVADIWIPMALGIINTMLLSEKARLEKLVADLDRVDILATVKFLLVTLIILPALPDQDYTRFHLNPAGIWKIVILVSTVGFFGYILIKRFGPRVGLWLSGLLGGTVSSTAVTLAGGRMAQRSPEMARDALEASLLASSVMYLRSLVLIALVSPVFVWTIWWKLCALALIGLATSFRLRREPSSTDARDIPGLENPFEITPALLFAGLFVLMSVVTAIVTEIAGSTGLLTLASLVGVSDIAPFMLSIVKNPDSLGSIASKAIILSMMSNTVVKGLYFAWLVPNARKETTIRFGALSLLHVPFLFMP